MEFKLFGCILLMFLSGSFGLEIGIQRKSENLTERILNGPSSSQGNVHQQMNPSSNVYPSSDHYQQQGSGQEPITAQNPGSSSIPPIYVQIMTALEKIVGRIDQLDSRVRTLENIVLYLTKGEDIKAESSNVVKQDNCPQNFTKIAGVRSKCLHFSSFAKEPILFDWKSANHECKRIGGRLAELSNYEDFIRVARLVAKYADPRRQVSTDFWTGGINPGLIWIWSESGQAVTMDKRFWNENDNSSNAPGCLKLSYSYRLKAFFFKSSPCSHSLNLICEVLDNSVARALIHFENTEIMST